jgi:uncharacterized protein involved in exopolysaccharide biosynthesis
MLPRMLPLNPGHKWITLVAWLRRNWTLIVATACVAVQLGVLYAFIATR